MAKKQDTLANWRKLKRGQNPLKAMWPIPYKTKGSRYGCCGIRIDGSPNFIDAVLSNLKDLLDGENAVTRLELARNKVQRQEGFNAGENASSDAEVCYIRLHERGREAVIAGALLGSPDEKAATERYAHVLGIEENREGN